MASQFESDQDLVKALNAIDHGLSDWEVGFAESLYAWVLKDGRTLTERQRAKAEAIMAKYDGKEAEDFDD